MYRFEPGVYTAEKQPDIIVTYGGEIEGEDFYGPWIQWEFPWDEGKFTTSFFSEFQELVQQVGYVLKEPRPSKGFRIMSS